MITLQDMVANRSVSEEGAALLRGIGAAGHSFLVYARPRNAGKSTLAEAIVAEAHPDLPLHEYLGTEQEFMSLQTGPGAGYLLVAEIGHRGRPGYLSGESVGRLFQLLRRGYALASSLHADSVAEVFDVLERNGIDAGAAAAVRYLIKVRPLGDPDHPATQRVVEAIHIVNPATVGPPTSSLLYEWSGLPSQSRRA